MNYYFNISTLKFDANEAEGERGGEEGERERDIKRYYERTQNFCL